MVAHPVVVQDVEVDGAGVIDGLPVLDGALLGAPQLPLDGLQLVEQLQRRQFGFYHDHLVEERIRLEPPCRGLDDGGASHNTPHLPFDEPVGQPNVELPFAQVAAQSDDGAMRHACPFRERLVVDEKQRLRYDPCNHTQ